MSAKAMLLCAMCAVATSIPLLSPGEEDIVSFVQTGVATGAGLNVSSLAINGGPNRESKLMFGDGKYALVLKGDTGDFEIRHNNQRSLVVTKEGNLEVFGKLSSKGAVRIDGKVNFMGIDQWLLGASEDFSAGAPGWSNDTVSVCGFENKRMLGGFGKFAGGEVHKTFTDLPPHNSVRLVANYHYIDSWGGETAYAKLEHRLAWTDSFELSSAKAGINLCGGAAPEGRFSQRIDVTLPHTCVADEPCTLTVGFGSTLATSPTDASWGVSDVMIYVR